MSTKRVTAPSIAGMKGAGIVCVTAYDFPTARLADEAGVDLILVGDSLGSVLFGYSTTIPVSLEMIEHHTIAAARGAHRALVVADLPFGSYQASVEDAVRASVLLMKAGAGAVKLEGTYTEHITAIARAGIPVMGHVGMTPQSYHSFGGHRVQREDAVLDDAVAVQNAGCFSVVLELVPAELAGRITKKLAIPTIGIGAGVHCDGQIQVFHDLLGFSDAKFKHAKRYAEVGDVIRTAISSYAEEVRTKVFPGDENSF